MPRRHVLFAVATLLLFCANAALACNCGSGGACHCAGACNCASGSSAADLADPMAGMTTPSEKIVAVAAASPQTVHVLVNDFTFGADVTLNVGDTVQWDWNSSLAHTISSVVGSAEPFDSGTLFAGSYSHTFTTPGTLTYYCKIHGIDNFDGSALGMAATVTVQAVPEPTTLVLLPFAALTYLTTRRSRRAA